MIPVLLEDREGLIYHSELEVGFARRCLEDRLIHERGVGDRHILTCRVYIGENLVLVGSNIRLVHEIGAESKRFFSAKLALIKEVLVELAVEIKGLLSIYISILG